MNEMTVTCPKCGAKGQTVAFRYDGVHITCRRCRMQMFLDGDFHKMTSEEISNAARQTAEGIYALAGGSDESWRKSS